MSYSRWINSSWYAFYEDDNHLALWGNKLYSWEFWKLNLITSKELEDFYNEQPAECIEAIGYIHEFQKDYLNASVSFDKPASVAIFAAAWLNLQNEHRIWRV